MSRTKHTVSHIGRILLNTVYPERVASGLNRLSRELTRYEVMRMLTRPRVDPGTLWEAVETAFPGTHPSVVGLVVTLAHERRLGLFPEVARWVGRQQTGAGEISVRTAAPLTAGQRSRLIGVLGWGWGATTVVHESIAPGLIAGMIIRRGWHEWDYSLAGALKRLGRQLNGA